MSVPVPVDELATLAATHGEAAYVLVGGADGPPRVTHSVVEVVGAVIEVSVGRRAAAALIENPTACVLWPAPEPGAMSLIVDTRVLGAVPGGGGAIRLEATGAVRHRPA